MRRLASPRWIASHLFVLAMVVLMANLGLWQLRRLDERRTTNEATAAAMASRPLRVERHLDAARRPRDHTAVTATGTYLRGHEVLIANRSSGGLPGSWLATPLELEDGRVVAVVRGWVSRRILAGSDAGSGAAAEAAAPPAGTVTVGGLLFGSVEGGRIGVTDPGETPEISRMDTGSFAEASGVAVEHVWIRLRQQSPPQPQALPVPVPDPDLSAGPHLSYAFQWFFFSASTVVVYALILRRITSRRTGPDPPADA